MTVKETLIISYLKNHNGQGYYIDIRDSIDMKFDDEEDFDNTINRLCHQKLIFENDNDTLYKIIN